MNIEGYENLKEVMRASPNCFSLSPWERGFAGDNKDKNYLSEKQLLVYTKIVDKLRGHVLTSDVLDKALEEIDSVIYERPEPKEPDGWKCSACHESIAPMQAHILAPQDGKMVHVHMGECADAHASKWGSENEPLEGDFDDGMPF